MSLATAAIVAKVATETAAAMMMERFDLSQGVMFKILHIKGYILNIKLDEEGGGSQNGRGDGSDNKGNNGDDEW
jgi:hypothetical protein